MRQELREGTCIQKYYIFELRFLVFSSCQLLAATEDKEGEDRTPLVDQEKEGWGGNTWSQCSTSRFKWMTGWEMFNDFRRKRNEEEVICWREREDEEEEEEKGLGPKNSSRKEFAFRSNLNYTSSFPIISWCITIRFMILISNFLCPYTFRYSQRESGSAGMKAIDQEIPILGLLQAAN